MNPAVTSPNAIDELKAIYRKISHLNHAASLLHWDMETMMPEKGAEARAQQLATLSELIHQHMTSEHMKRTLEACQSAQLSREEKAMVRELQRQYDKSSKLPSELVAREAEVTGKAHHIWVSARKNKCFSEFSPILKEIVAIKREQAEYFGYSQSRYNALLDNFEPGLNVADIDVLFGQLKPQLVDLVKAIANSSVKRSFDFLNYTFDTQKQWDFSERVIRDMGFDFDAGRLDKAPHPFCTNFSIYDVRLTTRVFENDLFSALFSSMHEAGHGLVEQGAKPDFEDTPLTGASMGIHESQSRMWENLVGRSQAFWQYYHKPLTEMFPKALANTTPDDIYYAVNQSRPSFIRVEADEVTYNLHIILRYELEKALMQDELSVDDLPAAWNAKMQDFLGITPPDDAQGVLQDVHWSGGAIGYFPTYTLGNLYSAQFFQAAKKAVSDLDQQIAKGNFTALKKFLNCAIHWDGQCDDPKVIVERVTGEAPNPAYFMEYLTTKFKAIYQL